MAQQVAIAGAVFNDVPYIQCPDANNVLHSFYDTTIASNAASASDIAQGKLAYVNGSLITGTNQGGLVYETGTWKPANDVANATISFSNPHTTAPFLYMIVDAEDDYSSTTDSNYYVMYSNFHQLTGVKWNVNNSGTFRVAMANYSYRSTATGFLASYVNIAYPYTDPGDSNSGYSRYWRSSRTYKWIAVWTPTS